MKRLWALALAMALLAAEAMAVDHAKNGRRLIQEAQALVEGCENRYQGSEGNLEMSRRIAQRFRESGVPWGMTRYDAPVFVPGRAEITVDGRRIRVHVMHPNLAELSNIPERRFSGRVYYVGDGEWADFDQRQIEGSLCLFDFRSGKNYFKAMQLGARGCLFIEPDDYSPSHAYDKILWAPLTVPRYQVPREDGLWLKERAAGPEGVPYEADVEPNRWERKELANHWALVKGSDPERRDELVVLFSHLDSMHYCPELASGGREAMNLKLFLDLFDEFRESPSKQSILFQVFNSSHQQHMGAAEAVFHLFAERKDIFQFEGNYDSNEQRSLQKDLEEANTILEHYPRMAPDKISQEVVDEFRELELRVGGANFLVIEPLLKRIERDIFQIQQDRGRLLVRHRKAGGGELPPRIKELDEQRKRIGYIVSMFNQVQWGEQVKYELPALDGRGDYTEEERAAVAQEREEAQREGQLVVLNDEQRELFEYYRKEVMRQAREERDRVLFLLDRLEEVERARQVLWEENNLQPMLALGMDLTYSNPWMTITMARGTDVQPGTSVVSREYARFTNAGGSGRLTRLANQLGTAFENRVAAQIDSHLPPEQTGIYWAANKSDAQMFKDFRTSGVVNYTLQSVPGYDFVTPYDLRKRVLSSEDRLENLNPAMVSRKAAFLRSAIRLILEDEKTKGNLTNQTGEGEWVPKLGKNSAESGHLAARIEDGSSLGDPTWPLEDGLAVFRWFTRADRISGVQGGVLGYQLLPADVSGRATYYNMPYGSGEKSEVYGFDDEGRIIYASDYGQTAQKHETLLLFKSGFREYFLFAAIRGDKADLYDLHAPHSCLPLKNPILETEGGGVYKWYSRAGFNPEKVYDAGQVMGDGTGCLFIQPEVPAKVLLSDDVALVNTQWTENREELQHLGYTAPDLDRASVALLSTKDVVDLNTDRIAKLKRNAVTNDLVERLHQRSVYYLKGDEDEGTAGISALQQQQRYLEGHRRAVQAYGAAFGAYPVVKATFSDMMKAVVFYLAVLIPFCFFMQRLLFSFTRIEAQIASFVLLFLVTYAVFNYVHPAFEIAKNPQVVLIAFTMIVLGGFVSVALRNKFDYHMAGFKERFGVGEDARALKLAGTAMLIGVSNMKRRRLRTTLTCATIVLITFTMLSFTSVSQSVSPTRVREGDDVPYNGLFYAHDAWLRLPKPKREMLTGVVAEGGDYLLRGFNRYGVSAELILMTEEQDRQIPLMGLLALQQKEDGWLAPMRAGAPGSPLVAGRFFSDKNAREVLVTDVFAEDTLRMSFERGSATLPEDRYVYLDSVRLKVVGILDGKQMRDLNDLRGKSIVPQELRDKMGGGKTVDTFEKEGEVPENTFKNVEPQYYVVVPFGLRRTFQIPVVSVSIKLPDAQSVWDRVMEYVYYSTDKIHFGADERFVVIPAEGPGEEPIYERPGRYYLGSGFETTIGGLSSLIIPLLISASIIFNTMLGAVYERRREIGIYNAIGLNPIHVALFFVAEAVVYGILGAVGGYLIGQVLAKIIVHFGWLPDINLNYSSLSVVYVILFTMLIVIISTLYPALMAMRTASASSGRRKPERVSENRISVLFPYSFTREMAIAVSSYLVEYLDKHQDVSVGSFVSEPVDIQCNQKDGEDLRVELRSQVALAPYDLGVTQRLTLVTEFHKAVGAFMVRGEADRISGMDKNWLATNQPFLDGIRKYLLRWRLLTPEGQEAHRQNGLQMLGLKG